MFKSTQIESMCAVHEDIQHWNEIHFKKKNRTDYTEKYAIPF